MRTSTLAVLLGLIIGVGSVHAQEQRASLEGVARDSTGALLPGATVEAKNLGQGAVSSTVTDGQGQFRFPALAPGAYQVTATLTGFAQAKFDRVDLNLGEIKRIELTLGAAGVAEQVQVTADQPLIDVKQNQRSFSITAEQFERLPRGRDFTSIVTQAPGANFERLSGGITIDGSSASENRFVIDGVETTDPETGVQGMRMSLDLVGEVQVKSAGYTAEYGGSTGGVINVITRTGTNAFRGDVAAYFTGDALQSDPRPTLRLSPTNQRVSEYVEYPEDGMSRVDPGFAIGGPIFKDKLWFFGSYYPGLLRNERTAPLSNGTSTTQEQTDRQHFLIGNVSSQFSQKANAKFSYNSAYRTIDGVLPAQNGTTSPQTIFDTQDKRPTYNWSGELNYVATDKLFFGVKGGYYQQNQYTEGIPTGTRFQFTGTTNIGLAGVPVDLQRPTGFNSESTATNIDRNKYGRTNFQADTTYYATFGGNHTFRGGLQVDRISNDVFEGETWGNLVRIRWDQNLAGFGRGQFGHYQVRSNGVSPDQGFITEGSVANTRVGLFFQDSWTIKDRLTLNLGVRTENEGVPAYTTEGVTSDVSIDWGFADKVAPRLGFAWDVTGNGRTKVSGAWGLYYDIFKMELPRGSFGGDKWLEYYYTLDTPNWPTLDPAGCPPACPGTLLRGPVDFRHPSFENIDPDIEPMRLQEAMFGIEREIGRAMAIGARYIHKQIDIAVEDIGSLDAAGNEIYTIGNPGFGLGDSAFTGVPFPKSQRDYDAVELTFDKRLANRWSFRSSYTLSRLYGNYSGLSQSDENGRTSPNVGRNFDYPVMAFDGGGRPVFGRLATDRPHQFKAQAVYELPFGTYMGANFYLASGVPVTREAAIYPPNSLPVQYRGRESDGRMPALSFTDLSVSHTFRLGGGNRALQLHMNVANLFDQDTALDRFPTQLVGGSGIVFDEAAFYAGQVNFDALIAALGPNALEPRFLQDRNFLDQRLIRFGVKFSF